MTRNAIDDAQLLHRSWVKGQTFVALQRDLEEVRYTSATESLAVGRIKSLMLSNKIQQLELHLHHMNVSDHLETDPTVAPDRKSRLGFCLHCRSVEYLRVVTFIPSFQYMNSIKPIFQHADVITCFIETWTVRILTGLSSCSDGDQPKCIMP